MVENYIIKQIDISKLSSKERKTFQRFLPRELHWCFQETDGKVTGIGAWFENHPIGIALGYVEKTPFLGKIFTLHVEEDHCKKQIGSKLFSELMLVLKNEGCRHLVFNYPGDQPSTPALEHILKKHNWEGPRVFVKRYHFDGFKFNPDWLNKPLHFQNGFEVFPWQTLKKSEQEQIKDQVHQSRFDLIVSPFGKDDDKIEPLNSLGLRYKGEVVGWMITHRIARDTIRYSSLYIHKEYLFRANWIKLLIESINLQRHSSIQWAIFEINVQQVGSSWDNFVRRKLAPYATSITRELQCWYSYYPIESPYTSAR